jgi:uncharacterized protein
MAEFVLKVQDIDERGKDYDFPVTGAWLDSALEGTPLRRDPAHGDGRFELHAQRNGDEILVRGDLTADLLVECSRCLSDTALHVETPVTSLLSQAGSEELPEEIELDSEDLDRAQFAGHEVVLDELVREHLLLECPMQPLCAPGCKGIQIPEKVRPPAEAFGEGRIDPRLSPLEQLRDKLSGKKE